MQAGTAVDTGDRDNITGVTGGMRQKCGGEDVVQWTMIRWRQSHLKVAGTALPAGCALAQERRGGQVARRHADPLVLAGGAL